MTNFELTRLQADLDKILRNNNCLELIAKQYEKEILRRKASLTEKIEETKMDSPLRRNRAYLVGVGGSPSPKKHMIVFDPDGKKINCEE